MTKLKLILQQMNDNTYDCDQFRMFGVLPVGYPVLGEHVTREVELRLEGAAGRAPDSRHLPRLGGLALGHMPQVGEDLALVTEGAHPGMLWHLPFAREEPAAVRAIVLKVRLVISTKSRQALQHKNISLNYDTFSLF